MVTIPISPPTLLPNDVVFFLSFLQRLLLLPLSLVFFLSPFNPSLKPKKPSFDLQQVGVQYMGITTPTTSATDPTTSASLSLNIQMLFTAVNPNSNLSHVAFGSGG
ncbi:COP9 signalosome complex subunit 8 [Fagus crenata]